jgi:hypothetical protein
MARILNADNPTKIVHEHAMMGHEWVHASQLRSAAETDADLIAGLQAAHNSGLEVKGFVPHHIWMEFLGTLGPKRA